MFGAFSRGFAVQISKPPCIIAAYVEVETAQPHTPPIPGSSSDRPESNTCLSSNVPTRQSNKLESLIDNPSWAFSINTKQRTHNPYTLQRENRTRKQREQNRGDLGLKEHKQNNV